MARYIDADKGEERFKYIYCDDCDSRNGVRCRACDFRDGADVFSDAPTEDVQPVVHAHWILRRPFAQCSKCKRFCGQWDYDSADNYCRNCGAKMDEEPEADES